MRPSTRETRESRRSGLEIGVRLAICDSLSSATIALLTHLGAITLKSQNRKPLPRFWFRPLCFMAHLANALPHVRPAGIGPRLTTF
jgi:hypothetical protein